MITCTKEHIKPSTNLKKEIIQYSEFQYNKLLLHQNRIYSKLFTFHLIFSSSKPVP